MDTKIWGLIGGIALVVALLSPFVLGSSKKVERIFEDAETAYEDGRYENALERYNKALKESKKFGVKTDTIVPEFQAYIHYKRAQCEKQLGNVNVALERYREVIVKFPESQYVTDSYVDSGNIYFDREDYEAASKEYKRALETTEDGARREQIQIALAFINSLPPPPPPPLPELEDLDTLDFAALTEAISLRFKERFQEAATQYNAFASNYLPTETAVYALYWAGRCYHKAGLFQQSVDTFKELIDDYAYTPNTIEAYHGLSAVYFDWAKRDEDTSKCQLVIETVEEAEQEYADSRAALDQQVLSLMRKIKRQVEEDETCQWEPEPPPEEVITNQGREYFDRGELELAEEKAREARRINATYQPAHQLLADIKKNYYEQGLLYLDNNHYGNAIIKFKWAISIGSEYKDKEVYCDLGAAYFNLHNLAYAEDAALKSLNIDPNYEPARQLLNAIREQND
ncbi:MAG: tetratricopeptide repeat protein [Candidatus Poribacteria bacterium]|nr:tetratricopeptide repeat protein [Candidatus Poribacteria bacterium]